MGAVVSRKLTYVVEAASSQMAHIKFAKKFSPKPQEPKKIWWDLKIIPFPNLKNGDMSRSV